MEKEVLDTSVLIRHWRRCRAAMRGPVTPAVVRGWAESLIRQRKTDAIVTPVYVEMLAGATSAEELRLTRAFLEKFRRIDGGRIPEGDWAEAIRLAQRVPRDAKPRQLGDCLIRAIAKRLRYTVFTHDAGFPPR
jgi:predicted nucleic acid-binding protein